MAASFSTLRANRLGGGLPSGLGGVSSLTITLNCRSRRARLRGAAGSADTRFLAVASDVPFQASAGMPPVRTFKKPVGLSSKLGTCADAGQDPARMRTKAETRLAREAIIGDGDLEMPHRRAGLEHRKRHHAPQTQGDDDPRAPPPTLLRGHT